MKYAIDETELARLEALACAAGAGDYSAHEDADDSAKFAAAACNAVPALIAEVRRLNDIILNDIDIDVQNKVSIVHLTHENAALREKVEAWEWLEECRQCMEWLYAVCWETTPVREAEHSFLAAARAVHAERE